MSLNPNNPEDEQDQNTTEQSESELNTIETILANRLSKLENSTFDQAFEAPEKSRTTRILSALKRYALAEESTSKENLRLKKQLEELEMERDVLMQQVHMYLETNSSLRVRLEEQRCQTGTNQRQLNSSLELQMKALECEKESLADLNVEKEKEIDKLKGMLEEMVKCLRSKEAEAWRKEQSATSAGRRRGNREKRSLSEGEVGRGCRGVMERRILLEPPRGIALGRKNKANAEIDNSKDTTQSPSVHAQLNALRRDLLSVTRKLDTLKLDLVNSGVVAEEPGGSRRLKRKAKPPEEEGEREDEEEDAPEEQKLGFKNLKNILQDAKNLNAKLESLREEKQKMMDATGGGPSGFVFPCGLGALGCVGEGREGNSFMGERSNRSEDGGGDNLMKNPIPTDGGGCKELKIQIPPLKFKTDHLEKA